MTSVDTWSGRVVGQAREIVTTWLPLPCGQGCGRIVDGTEPWVVGHKVPRWQRPDLALDPANWHPECRKCSDASGPREAAAKQRAIGAAEALSGFLPAQRDGGSPRPFPSLSLAAQDDQWTVPARMRWSHHVQNAPAWLRPYLDVPANAAPPLAMTEVHPRAVCSYAAESCMHGWRGVPFVVPLPAIAWVEQARRIRLRWWQRLAMVRQLEHDEDGRLCWFNVVESGTRRIGKSERLRSVALWRMERGVELFEPGQTVIHFGNKLDVVREVQERAWPWCESQGWAVSKNNNKPGVTHPNGARWLAKTTAYSFDVHLGLADECWDIEPPRISEDLEPAALERESAQVVTTSTSHRKATALMKRKIAAALAYDDLRTLLLLWGVEPGADIFAEETWRAASAHWSDDRRDQMAAKLVEAQEAGPSIDDPDPVGSWANQYLNVWDLVVRPKVKGEQLVDADRWAELVAGVPEGKPAAAAIESWFEDGVTAALAWRLDDGAVVVSAADLPDLAAAVAVVKASGYRGRAIVGSSLREDPAVKGKLPSRAGEGPVIVAVQEFQRLLGEGVVRHDGGAHLAGQVVELRTKPGANGPLMASTGRADAVKAAVWAVRAARARGAGSQIRGMVLPRT